jgi:hypothetical protein
VPDRLPDIYLLSQGRLTFDKRRRLGLPNGLLLCSLSFHRTVTGSVRLLRLSATWLHQLCQVFVIPQQDFVRSTDRIGSGTSIFFICLRSTGEVLDVEGHLLSGIVLICLLEVE